MKQERQKRESLWRRMRREYDRALLHCCRMEMMGRHRLVVQGCQDILEYGRTRIRLAVCDAEIDSLLVCGCELSCLSYHPDAVVIEGEIGTVCFCSGEGSEEA